MSHPGMTVHYFSHHHSLVLFPTGHVLPDSGRVLKLVGVDQNENQHGVDHHRHPEILQDPPPPHVVNLTDIQQHGKLLELRS